MAIGYAFMITGLIMIIKGWIRVYYAGGRLVTDGIYGIVRHPQYTGIFLAIFGQLAHWPTILTLALSPAIVLAYVHLARWEERRLIAQFGSAYADYQQHVPMFFPRWQTVRQLLAAS